MRIFQTPDDSVLRLRLQQRAKQLRKLHTTKAVEAFKEAEERGSPKTYSQAPTVVKGPSQTPKKASQNWWDEIPDSYED